MPRFFMAGTNILGGMAIMKGRDAEHVRVLRLRPGEDMIICDGQGTDYKCRLVKADKEQVEAEVVEVVRCPAEPSVKAVRPAKGRQDGLYHPEIRRGRRGGDTVLQFRPLCRKAG